MAEQKQTGGMLPEHIGIIMDGNGRLHGRVPVGQDLPVPSGRLCGTAGASESGI